jgi:hypothetical protein
LLLPADVVMMAYINKPLLFFIAAAISVFIFAVGLPSAMHAGQVEVFELVWVTCVSILPVVIAIFIARRKK